MVQVAAATVNLLDSKFLFASLLWGSVGFGYFIYGKKQQATMPMIGGVVMVAISYLVGSWFWMSLLCLALMFVVYWLVKQGY
ncbi:MAG: amino acid transport protein [Verrucomicrobiota bacterium]